MVCDRDSGAREGSVADLYKVDTMLAAGGGIAGRPAGLVDLHGVDVQSIDCRGRRL